MNDVYNIALIYKSGKVYRFDDVKILIHHLHKCYSGTSKLQIFVFCDLVDKYYEMKGFSICPLPYKTWEGWWAKMNLFSPELSQHRPFLYIDLDTAVLSLKSVLGLNGKYIDSFIMLRDFYKHNLGASGIMWIPNSNKVNTIWNRWIDKPDYFISKFRGDQEFINSVTIPDSYWQDIIDGIYTYKPVKFKHRTVLNGEEIVCFHGKPKIYEAMKESEWVKNYVNEAI